VVSGSQIHQVQSSEQDLIVFILYARDDYFAGLVVREFEELEAYKELGGCQLGMAIIVLAIWRRNNLVIVSRRDLSLLHWRR
jgi:hypothetical protein